MGGVKCLVMYVRNAFVRDDHQVDPQPAGQGDDGPRVVDVDRIVGGHRCRAGVAGRAEQSGDGRVVRQCQSKRVFAPTAADDQDGKLLISHAHSLMACAPSGSPVGEGRVRHRKTAEAGISRSRSTHCATLVDRPNPWSSLSKAAGGLDNLDQSDRAAG